jgi:putative FmdB family regulatory protein
MEVFQKFSDPPLTKCEQCKGKVHKLISQSSFHLKGTGWYVTDYASKGAGREVKKKDSKVTEAKDSAPKETKGESASPAKEAKAQP